MTGGSGRLSQSVVQQLTAMGHDVVSADVRTVELLPARQITVDLRNHDATLAIICAEAPEAVVHLAAIAIPFSAPEDIILQVNNSMAWNVIEAASASGASRVLVASSPTIVGYGAPGGWTPLYFPLDESHPAAPWNAYALSKQIVENMISMFCLKNPNIQYGAFRPCFTVSPDEWQGEPTQLGHTIVDRLNDPALAAVALFNYLDARDGAAFVRLWLENAAELENASVFFVGADDALAQESLEQLIPRYFPSWSEQAKALVSSAPAFSSAKAKQMLGWQPTRSWRKELSPSQRLLLHPIALS